MKVRLFILFFLTITASPVLAQAKAAKNTPTEKKEIISEKDAADLKRKEEEQKLIQKYYSKLKNPPGFYEGAFLVSFMGGTTLAPSGSYISHEKVYDQTIQNKIISGQVNQDIDPGYRGL